MTQLSWTNHLLIMSDSKSDEEREFYLRLAIKERYSKRQLERQMDSRTLSPMMVAQYQLQLPDKDILRKKLQELSSLPKIEETTGGSDNI